MTTQTDSIIEITDVALDQILALREQESVADLHLGLRISGVGTAGFVYETAFLRPDDVSESDHIEHHRGLPVAIPQDSVDNLRGSVLDMSTDPHQSGLVLRNPNPATPDIAEPGPRRRK